ncbi:MAG: hypothetical protein QXP70_01240 [Methanomassiliicoccales archaeon]
MMAAYGTLWLLASVAIPGLCISYAVRPSITHMSWLLTYSIGTGFAALSLSVTALLLISQYTHTAFSIEWLYLATVAISVVALIAGALRNHNTVERRNITAGKET